MPKLRHALTGAIYDRTAEGLVQVEHDGKTGLFHPDGRWHSGELKSADIHLLLWVGGRELPGRGLFRAASEAPKEGAR